MNKARGNGKHEQHLSVSSLKRDTLMRSKVNIEKTA
jgi:hypothetical protein